MPSRTYDRRTMGKTPLGSGELSAREFEVLELASAGLTNGHIARTLGVSVHAVKFHLASIYRKLGVANRTAAAVAYLTDGANGLRVSETGLIGRSPASSARPHGERADFGGDASGRR